LSEQLCSIVTRVRASQVRDIEDRLKQIGQNLHLIWQRQFTNHWLAKTRRNRLIRSITFLSTGLLFLIFCLFFVIFSVTWFYIFKNA